VHRHVVAALRADPDDDRTPVVASEFVTTSISTRGLPDTATSILRSNNPDLLHARSDERGYTAIELLPQRMSCDLRATAFPVTADARMHSQARFVVEAGRPLPQPA
jgi:alkaline phosphatase D